MIIRADRILSGIYAYIAAPQFNASNTVIFTMKSDYVLISIILSVTLFVNIIKRHTHKTQTRVYVCARVYTPYMARARCIVLEKDALMNRKKKTDDKQDSKK